MRNANQQEMVRDNIIEAPVIHEERIVSDEPKRDIVTSSLTPISTEFSKPDMTKIGDDIKLTYTIKNYDHLPFAVKTNIHNFFGQDFETYITNLISEGTDYKKLSKDEKTDISKDKIEQELEKYKKIEWNKAIQKRQRILSSINNDSLDGQGDEIQSDEINNARDKKVRKDIKEENQDITKREMPEGPRSKRNIRNFK